MSSAMGKRDNVCLVIQCSEKNMALPKSNCGETTDKPKLRTFYKGHEGQNKDRRTVPDWNNQMQCILQRTLLGQLAKFKWFCGWDRDSIVSMSISRSWWLCVVM